MHPLLTIALITAKLSPLQSFLYDLLNLLAILFFIGCIVCFVLVGYHMFTRPEDPDDGVIFKSVVTITRRIKADEDEETEDEEEDEENTPDTPEAPGPDTHTRTETHKPASL